MKWDGKTPVDTERRQITEAFAVAVCSAIALAYLLICMLIGGAL